MKKERKIKRSLVPAPIRGLLDIQVAGSKDMFEDGTWAQMGKGSVDFEGITSFLFEIGYNGWIIVEDECDRAVTDPDGVTIEDGDYAHNTLEPLVEG